jgi:HEAT repeat protein
VEIYTTDRDPAVKRSVIAALGMQDNAEALVALARKEADVTMKKEIVSRLAHMDSKIATDYMLEILNAK